MDNLEPGTVWKHIIMPGYELVITEVTDETITCHDCHPTRHPSTFSREEFLEHFKYYLPEYLPPTDNI